MYVQIFCEKYIYTYISVYRNQIKHFVKFHCRIILFPKEIHRSMIISSSCIKSQYSLVIVPKLDVSFIVIGNIVGGDSYEIVLINVGHKLSTLNVE